MKNQHGFTLVEFLVSSTIMLIALYAFGVGISFFMKMSKTTIVGAASDRNIQDIAENIKIGIENYQVNFNMISGKVNAELEDALDEKNLPMAWDSERTCALKDAGCITSLPGRFGYIVQPFDEFRGLYKVTLRMTHTDWIASGEPYRDYVFVVSAR